MSPIDDELRTALSSRTETVGLSPDFFAGVERRARRMRRQRVTAAVAGSALAVSALGLGGPLLASSLTRDTAPPTVATAPPTPADDRFALDPAAPWDYRGLPLAELGDGFLRTAEREWQVRHPGSDLVPLFGQVHAPSGRSELVFLGRGDADAPDGLRYGLVVSGESGPDVVVDEDLFDSERRGIALALSGDEVPRLLVVAAPTTTLEYAPSEQALRPMAVLADGVGTTPLAAGLEGDRYAVRAPDGSVVKEVGAPDPAGPVPDEEPAAETPVAVDVEPYALDPGDPWEFRGDRAVADELVAVDEDLFLAGGAQRDPRTTTSTPLFAARYPSGVGLVVVLHVLPGDSVVTTTWQRGDRAPQQSEQLVLPGTLLVQSAVPTDLDDESLVVLALASPEATAVESSVPEAEVLEQEDSWATWQLPGRSTAGEVFAYATGDGLLYHSEPARRS